MYIQKVTTPPLPGKEKYPLAPPPFHEKFLVDPRIISEPCSEYYIRVNRNQDYCFKITVTAAKKKSWPKIIIIVHLN